MTVSEPCPILGSSGEDGDVAVNVAVVVHLEDGPAAVGAIDLRPSAQVKKRGDSHPAPNGPALAPVERALPDEVARLRRFRQARGADFTSFFRPLRGWTARRPPNGSTDAARQKVYEIDPLLCTFCGAEIKILSFITELKTIKAILDCMDLPPQKPEPLAHSPPLFNDTVYVPF